ncbi:hypothetical protein [Demequina sp. NBRC 110052]|uniref:hypothetical protein n=1 Tax=Demequina sp. NBRC 110052 TaxID=1570341 RepID=UPI00117C0D80|nr:hypothetical protein [Demequina sp. NBRC 110052]
MKVLVRNRTSLVRGMLAFALVALASGLAAMVAWGVVSRVPDEPVDRWMLFAQLGTAIGTSLLAISTLVTGFAAEDSASAAADLASEGRVQAELARRSVLEAAKTRVDARSPLIATLVTVPRVVWFEGDRSARGVKFGESAFPQAMSTPHIEVTLRFEFVNVGQGHARVELRGDAATSSHVRRTGRTYAYLTPHTAGFSTELKVLIDASKPDVRVPVHVEATCTSQFEGDVLDAIVYDAQIRVRDGGRLVERPDLVSSDGPSIRRTYPSLEP